MSEPVPESFLPDLPSEAEHTTYVESFDSPLDEIPF